MGMSRASPPVTSPVPFPGPLAVAHTLEAVDYWICSPSKLATEPSSGTLLAAHGPPGPTATALST